MSHKRSCKQKDIPNVDYESDILAYCLYHLEKLDNCSSEIPIFTAPVPLQESSRRQIHIQYQVNLYMG